MENQTVTQKLEALVKLQTIDTKIDELKKLRGDLPDEVQDLEDEMEGYKTRLGKFESDLKELEDLIKKNKEGIKEAEKLVKKYNEQQKNVKNNREYDAITKEIELQELEVQICEKRIKESKDKIEAKKAEITSIETLIKERSEDLENKKNELNDILGESQEEEKKLLEDRVKATKKIDEKLLKYYERLRASLSNGLAVVRVVRGAAEGCNIIIPPQKIAEIKEKKKIVIDEHSGRILADVDMGPVEEEPKPKKQPQLKERKKLNNNLLGKVKKTGLTACFFLLIFFTSHAIDNVWVFDAELQKAYDLILNLRTEEADQQLQRSTKSNVLHKYYLLSFNETIEILITEDEKKFEAVDEKIKERIFIIENLPETAETLFLQAELTLQRAFNYINLNQNISATFALRRAYNLTQDCVKRYPNFIPIRKTNGVINVMVGSIPDKFSWMVSLMGMHGSVAVGQKQLEDLRLSKSSLSREATILFYTVKGFINLQFEDAAKGIQECLKSDPDNRLLLFIGVNMYFKSSQSEEANKLISEIDKNKKGLQIVYLEYLRAETLLQRGDYEKAIPVYQNFIKAFNSKNLKKDSYYKIAICHWLLNQPELARQYYEKAKKTGHEMADPDKFAAKQLEDPKFPNAKILKARFFTDGGYFKEAKEVIQTISPTELTTQKDRTEYLYRKGRLAHKINDIATAKTLYHQTIAMTGENSWYFAPNAALQLGYIAKSEKDVTSAKKYFEKAMSYKRHEYKSSIDTKAKAALRSIKD